MMKNMFRKGGAILLLLWSANTVAAQTPVWSAGSYVYDGAGNIWKIGSETFIYDKPSRRRSGTAGTGRLQECHAGRVLRYFQKHGGTWTWKEDYVDRDRSLLAEVSGADRTLHFRLDHGYSSADHRQRRCGDRAAHLLPLRRGGDINHLGSGAPQVHGSRAR